jgi:dTDP-4-dehydrorhamnose 3,5-epimerase
MLFVPENCAHGHQMLEANTGMHYMTSAARGVRFDDPAFAIRRPLAATVISDQDRNWPLTER